MTMTRTRMTIVAVARTMMIEIIWAVLQEPQVILSVTYPQDHIQAPARDTMDSLAGTVVAQVQQADRLGPIVSCLKTTPATSWEPDSSRIGDGYQRGHSPVADSARARQCAVFRVDGPLSTPTDHQNGIWATCYIGCGTVYLQRLGKCQLRYHRAQKGDCR